MKVTINKCSIETLSYQHLVGTSVNVEPMNGAYYLYDDGETLELIYKQDCVEVSSSEHPPEYFAGWEAAKKRLIDKPHTHFNPFTINTKQYKAFKKGFNEHDSICGIPKAIKNARNKQTG